MCFGYDVATIPSTAASKFVPYSCTTVHSWAKKTTVRVWCWARARGGGGGGDKNCRVLKRKSNKHIRAHKAMFSGEPFACPAVRSSVGLWFLQLAAHVFLTCV